MRRKGVGRWNSYSLCPQSNVKILLRFVFKKVLSSYQCCFSFSCILIKLRLEKAKFSIQYVSSNESDKYNHRGGFRGGDLVTCHPLFSDMTLQSQILVIESLFLTSVSKYIRKYLLSRQFSYMYSSCSNPATSLIKFSDNFFQEKLSINESSITGTWFPCIVVR